MIYISDILCPAQMEKVIKETGAGIETIEFSISDNLDHLQQKIQEYKIWMNKNNIKDLTLHGPFLDLNPAAYDSQIQKVTLQRFSETYEAACQLGAKRIIYHTGLVPSIYFLEGWTERVAEFMNRFLEKRTQIEVSMENVYDPLPEPMMKLKQLVEAPNFSLCLDVGHAQCYSKVSVLEWMECLGDGIGHVHLHDNDGIRDAHWGLGKGKIPVEELFEKLKKISSDVTYTIECSAYEDVITTYETVNKYRRL